MGLSPKIGFSRSRGPISAIIRFFTRSDVSHAFLTYESEEFGKKMVIEEASSGCREESLERWATSNTLVKEVACGLPDSMVSAYGELLGSGYNWAALAGFSLPIIGRWFGKIWHNPVKGTSSDVCSESIVVCAQKLGLPYWERLVAQDTSPQDLLTFLSKFPNQTGGPA